MNSSAQRIQDRFDKLKSQRSELNARMEELTSLLYPYKNNSKSLMWDTTGSEACIKLSSLLSSLITPPGQRWHGLAEPFFAHQAFLYKEDAGAKKIREWCDQLTDTLFGFRERSGSGFVSCLQSFYTSIVEFGTGCFYIEADVDAQGLEDGIRYISVPLSSVYLSVNHQNVVDSIYREFEFTAEQVAHKWGKDSLSSQMRSSLERNDTDKFKFIHAVYPFRNSEKKKRGQGRNNFYSKFIGVDDSIFFEEKELRTLPYVIGRYRVRADEIYGKSPAMEALPAIRRSNEISNELAQYARLALNPPFLAPSDAKQREFKFKAGYTNLGTMSKEGRPLFQPIQFGNPLPFYEEIKRIESSIHSLFLLDLFQVLDDKASRSAAESMEKTREKGAFVGPLIGGLQSEFIGSMIRRELDILDSQNKIPELEGYAPPSVSVLKVEYTSPLFKYQQAESVSSVLQGTNTLVELGAKTGDPSYMDHIDIDKVSRFALWASNTPSILIRDSTEVEEIRQKRRVQMENMQEQQSQQQAQQMGIEVGAKVAGRVAEKKLERDMMENSYD
ncbi:portal protein [Candidatus Liberibacter africanus]|uniref:Head-to-tail joining protein n=1 Tax=Candidatus Liberibacter africanus PTSAPSY TaxID=1277257 RepID=A0A0G3I4A8_LIBAF|nr:portal protein [Candidatus Liberibacter africanus]AKK20065.1 head-to-tail joining protein [Candidatus Liberibacter africanus PTSAPSY]